jgi:hypothetical protein
LPERQVHQHTAEGADAAGGWYSELYRTQFDQPVPA